MRDSIRGKSLSVWAFALLLAACGGSDDGDNGGGGGNGGNNSGGNVLAACASTFETTKGTYAFEVNNASGDAEDHFAVDSTYDVTITEQGVITIEGTKTGDKTFAFTEGGKGTCTSNAAGVTLQFAGPPISLAAVYNTAMSKFLSLGGTTPDGNFSGSLTKK